MAAITLQNLFQGGSPVAKLAGAGAGPLAALDSSSYDFSSAKFPPDLGTNPQKGHYIIFNINVQDSSAYVANPGTSGVSVIPSGTPGATSGLTQQLQNAAGDQLSGIGTLGSVGSKPISFGQKTSRISQAIALYMPDNINVTYNAGYDSPGLSDAFGADIGKLAAFAGSSSLKDILNGDIRKAASTVWSDKVTGGLAASLPVAAEEAGSALPGSGGSQVALFAAGYSLNPQIQVIFRGVDLRTFQFDFLLAPNNAAEAAIIQNIITLFKFHQAPEVASGFVGRYFIPPSQFDIQFIHNGQINSNIHQISTCVMTNFFVDYAATGQWATYSDGAPVITRLQMQFQEIEIMTKSRILQGF